MSVIVGYGIVVSIKKFVNLFPGSFVVNKKYKYYEEGTIKNLGIDYYYNGHDTDYSKPNIFITTKNAVRFDVYRNTFINPYTTIDVNTLLQESEVLEDWLIEYFPDYKMEFVIYGNH